MNRQLFASVAALALAGPAYAKNDDKGEDTRPLSEQAAAHDPETGEVAGDKKSSDIVIAQATGTQVLIGGVAYQVKEQVTVPTLSQETGETVVIKIAAPFHSETKAVEKEVTVKGVKTMATEDVTIVTARVIEMTSGRLFSYVLNAISSSELERTFPYQSYVGEVFAIEKLGLVAGKRYKGVNILHLEQSPVQPDAE